MGGKALDWKFKVIIAVVICSIVGVIYGFIAVRLVNDFMFEVDRIGTFWFGFVIGFNSPIVIYLLEEKIYPCIAASERSKRWYRMKAGVTYEREYEKVEEKDDFKNLDWLKHHYYDLGKSIQDIADEQGVSMITIRKWIDKIEKW
ncbi:MAG: hypothetical protein ACFFCV_20300 [Promethearchaeota archaeon]